MEVVSKSNLFARFKDPLWLILAGILLGLPTLWFWRAGSTPAVPKEPPPIPVVSARVTRTDVPVRISVNGTVTAQQTIELRPRVSATVKSVHVREGQFVRKGQRLFSLDTRTEEANLSRDRAQIEKDRADLLNAERNLERQRELLKLEYISRAEFETAENQVALLRGQLDVDSAALEASRVARSFGEITAPIDGRTGAIAVYQGTLVQPNGAPLVTITQVDPINVSFTVPERDLSALQQAFAAGQVGVYAQPAQTAQPPVAGQLVFIDNAVDSASGTIGLKAQFPNTNHALWPGMFVTVTLAPRVLSAVLTVPVQAVQTGPEQKFVYVINDDHSVTARPVTVQLIQDGTAVITGVDAGAVVVAEGAQNLRPGRRVAATADSATATQQPGSGISKAGSQ